MGSKVETSEKESSLVLQGDQGAQNSCKDLQSEDKSETPALSSFTEKVHHRKRDFSRCFRVYLNSTSTKMRKGIDRSRSRSSSRANVKTANYFASRKSSRQSRRRNLENLENPDLQVTEISPVFSNKLIKKRDSVYQIQKRLTQKLKVRKSSLQMNQ